MFVGEQSATRFNNWKRHLSAARRPKSLWAISQKPKWNVARGSHAAKFPCGKQAGLFLGSCRHEEQKQSLKSMFKPCIWQTLLRGNWWINFRNNLEACVHTREKWRPGLLLTTRKLQKNRELERRRQLLSSTQCLSSSRIDQDLASSPWTGLDLQV